MNNKLYMESDQHLDENTSKLHKRSSQGSKLGLVPSMLGIPSQCVMSSQSAAKQYNQ